MTPTIVEAVVLSARETTWPVEHVLEEFVMERAHQDLLTAMETNKAMGVNV